MGYFLASYDEMPFFLPKKRKCQPDKWNWVSKVKSYHDDKAVSMHLGTRLCSRELRFVINEIQLQAKLISLYHEHYYFALELCVTDIL